MTAPKKPKAPKAPKKKAGVRDATALEALKGCVKKGQVICREKTAELIKAGLPADQVKRVAIHLRRTEQIIDKEV